MLKRKNQTEEVRRILGFLGPQLELLQHDLWARPSLAPLQHLRPAWWPSWLWTSSLPCLPFMPWPPCFLFFQIDFENKWIFLLIRMLNEFSKIRNRAKAVKFLPIKCPPICFIIRRGRGVFCQENILADILYSSFSVGGQEMVGSSRSS